MAERVSLEAVNGAAKKRSKNGEDEKVLPFCLKKGRIITTEKFNRWCKHQNHQCGCKNMVYITIGELNAARRNNNILVIER